MNLMWSMTISDVVEIYERAKKDGVKPGESIEKYIFEYAKEKGIKPLGATELTKEEMIKEQTSHGKNILDVEIDKNGKSTYKFKKGKEEKP